MITFFGVTPIIQEKCWVVSKAVEGRIGLIMGSSTSSIDRTEEAYTKLEETVRALETGGEGAAAALVSKLGAGRSEEARELAYRLYNICERKNRAAEALSYNSLVQSWPEIVRLAQQEPQAAQTSLF